MSEPAIQTSQNATQTAEGTKQSGSTGAAQQGSQQSAQQAAEWDGKVESLPQGAQDIIKSLRTENAAKRTAAKGAEDAANAKITAALKALGIEDAGTDDPVKLAEQAQKERDAEKAASRSAQLQLAVYKAAGQHGADPDALLDSNSFLASVKELDSTDAKAIGEAIKKAVAANPKLKTSLQAGAGQTGADFSGGTGGQPKGIAEQIADAEAKHDFKTSALLKAQLLTAQQAQQQPHIK
ncbi:hypothetical protein GCM10009785_01520 [Brooklawnia cerclae]|uniref:Scaffolding protein n=1 Tax=Brooklawnia cerclae TaxID=349934 RepID=A0ABX0SCX6_9ACTN|nr:hypothetical protein [Brooklawnia cerclae]NIH56254.1 hypothetical protein [Brooklawnia cerclae]